MDGVISLFGLPEDEPAPGSFHDIDGMSHCLGHSAGERLGRLAERFELVWATGWQDRANEYLPRLLGLEAAKLPSLTFSTTPQADAHWKLPAINEYAGDRPAAWIDDSLDERCERCASAGRPRCSCTRSRRPASPRSTSSGCCGSPTRSPAAAPRRRRQRTSTKRAVSRAKDLRVALPPGAGLPAAATSAAV